LHCPGVGRNADDWEVGLEYMHHIGHHALPYIANGAFQKIPETSLPALRCRPRHLELATIDFKAIIN